MVRTRSLDRALGRIIGRVLGREVSHVADETSQRRRPTASARRQRAVAPVVKDVEHVDHAANEIHEQPQEVVVDDVVGDA